MIVFKVDKGLSKPVFLASLKSVAEVIDKHNNCKVRSRPTTSVGFKVDIVKYIGDDKEKYIDVSLFFENERIMRKRYKYNSKNDDVIEEARFSYKLFREVVLGGFFYMKNDFDHWRKVGEKNNNVYDPFRDENYVK